MIRHPTATAIIINDRAEVLLLEHRRLRQWLGPGGHVEPNEDPEQAVCREVREEVGLEVDIVGEPRPQHPAVTTVAAPWTINVQTIPDHPSEDEHQHIDHIYVCTPAAGYELGGEYDGHTRWVPITQVADLPTPPELPGLVEAAAAWATRCGADVGFVPKSPA